jgi:hypothetical protein
MRCCRLFRKNFRLLFCPAIEHTFRHLSVYPFPTIIAKNQSVCTVAPFHFAARISLSLSLRMLKLQFRWHSVALTNDHVQSINIILKTRCACSLSLGYLHEIIDQFLGSCVGILNVKLDSFDLKIQAFEASSYTPWSTIDPTRLFSQWLTRLDTVRTGRSGQSGR